MQLVDMVTNPSTSSTSVSSSSLIEASSPSSTAEPTSVRNATPNLQNSTKPKTPVKRKMEDNTEVELVVPIAVESSSAVVNDDNKKRSRKQKIETLRCEYEVSNLEGLSASDKSAKRKKEGKKSDSRVKKEGDNGKKNNSRVKKEGDNGKKSNSRVKKEGDNGKKSNSRVKKEGDNGKKNNSRVKKERDSVKKNTSRVKNEGDNGKKNTATKKKGRNASAPKKSKNDNTKTATTAVRPPSNDPPSHIFLKKNELIDRNLSFTKFADRSRDLGAIGPSQVILAVESTREPGSEKAFLKDLRGKGSRSAKKPIVGQFHLFDHLLSVPHFLPLTSVTSSGEPVARILRYSCLEKYTNGVQCNNRVTTYQFYGHRYEKQVRVSFKPQETVVPVPRDPNAYLDSSVLIIKHPVIGYDSGKLVRIKFVVLKKVALENSVVGHLKAKVIQVGRSADRKQIDICYVDESRVPEAASDVSTMNQHNIQPVVQTSEGLMPLIARLAYQPQPQQELAERQFEYAEYQYRTPTELKLNKRSI